MKTPELVTPPPPIPKPSRSSRGCPGENECSSWQRQWYGDAMAHQESCPLVPRWKLRPRPRVAQWLPRHLPFFPQKGWGPWQRDSWAQEYLGQRGGRGLAAWAGSYLDSWLALGHKEEVRTPCAQRLLSRWPSPWRQLMIILPSVNIDHKCGSKGRKPWTVPGQGGAAPGSIKLSSCLAFPGASNPSLPESVAFLALFPSAQPAAPMTSGKVRTPGPPA